VDTSIPPEKDKNIRRRTEVTAETFEETAKNDGNDAARDIADTGFMHFNPTEEEGMEEVNEYSVVD
jgi:hypothetical protein